jgi:hypothetical protein
MENYKEQDGLKYTMEQRWSNSRQEFPSDLKDCIEKFGFIEKTLNDNYHPFVNLGVVVTKGGILTDHGPEHIQMVMRRALQIIGEEYAEKLTGYEIFLLLVAIHFHDLGNIYGREEHEKEIDRVMDKMGTILPLNIIDKNFVRDIAMAHGGYVEDLKTDRDTIRILKQCEPRDSMPVRLSLLAAILRFADELADDFTRTFDDKIDIPPENKLYHAYSSVLEVKEIKGYTVSLHYRIPYEYTQTKMEKEGSKIYLYDYIINRLEKCLRELEYCRKYSEGFIRITTLNVVISVISKNNRNKANPIDAFRLRLLGYPGKFKIDNCLERSDQEDIASTNKKLKYESGAVLKREIHNVMREG